MNPSSTCRKCKTPLPTNTVRGLWPKCLDLEVLKKYFRRAAIAVGILIALIASIYLVENWRGIRAWKQTKARIEAKGEKVDWAAFVPKSRLPDDQNVFQQCRGQGS